MKVIIIKKCKDGDVNDIIDVSPGYATNFLINNKFGLPYNKKTENMLKIKLNNIMEKENNQIENAKKIKIHIESLVLNFDLKTTNNIVHGSITKKQILKQLLKENIKIKSYNIENIQIQTLGITSIHIKLYKDVVAILKIKVNNG